MSEMIEQYIFGHVFLYSIARYVLCIKFLPAALEAAIALCSASVIKINFFETLHILCEILH